MLRLRNVPWLASCLLVLVALLLVPSAAATPSIKVRFEYDHEQMTLSEGGKGAMKVDVRLIAEDFVCPQPTKITANLHMDYDDMWAGASLQPTKAEWTIAANKPGMGSKVEPLHTSSFDLVWDVSGAPREGAKQDYTFTATDFKTDAAAPCQPNPPQPVVDPSPKMRAVLPDRPEPSETQCPPESGDCQSYEAIEVPEPTPSPGLVVLASGIMACAAWLRRRADRPRGR